MTIWNMKSSTESLAGCKMGKHKYICPFISTPKNINRRKCYHSAKKKLSNPAHGYYLDLLPFHRYLQKAHFQYDRPSSSRTEYHPILLSCLRSLFWDLRQSSGLQGSNNIEGFSASGILTVALERFQGE